MAVLVEIELLTDKQIVDEYRRRMAMRRSDKCTRCGNKRDLPEWDNKRCACGHTVGMFRNGCGIPKFWGYP